MDFTRVVNKGLHLEQHLDLTGIHIWASGELDADELQRDPTTF